MTSTSASEYSLEEGDDDDDNSREAAAATSSAEQPAMRIMDEDDGDMAESANSCSTRQCEPKNDRRRALAWWECVAAGHESGEGIENEKEVQ